MPEAVRLMVPHDPARNARGGPFDGSAYAVGRAEFTIKQLKTNTRTLKHKHALQSLMTECATLSSGMGDMLHTQVSLAVRLLRTSVGVG